MIVTGGLNHSFHGVDGAPYSYLNIMFRGDLPEAILNRPLSVPPQLQALMAKVAKEGVLRVDYHEELAVCCLTEILIGLIRQETLALPKPLQESPHQQNYHSEIVRRAMKLIANHYTEPLRLQSVAKTLGVSPSHLHFLLKNETGMNFTAILQRQRIEAAKFLLSTLPPTEVGEKIGYASNSFFFRLFRRLTGMSPVEYAKSLRTQ